MNDTFSARVAASPNPRFRVPQLGAEDEAALDALLARLTAKVSRDRAFNVRLFAEQFDKSHDGFLTKERFLRTLSMLKILPEKDAESALLLARFSTPRGVDYKAMLIALNMI